MSTPIILRFNEESILPWHLSNTQDTSVKYELKGGEIATFEYIKGFDLSLDKDLVEISGLCLRIFNIPFNKMYHIWKQRRPDLPLLEWYHIRMKKCLN